MRTRRTPVVAALGSVLASMLVLSACGTQTAGDAAPTPGTSPSPQNGTSPSVSSPTPIPPTDAPRAADDAPSDGIVSENGPSRTFGISDQVTGDFVVGLSSRDVVIGEVGIHGVGAAWATRRTTVRRTVDGLDAHYDGRGQLQRGAPLELGAAALSPSENSGEPERVHLRFEVHLDSRGLGHADVWIDGKHARLVATESPHTAGPIVTAVVGATRAEDWSAMYDLTVHLPGMTRASFVRTFGSDGSISSLELTGDTVYRVANGVTYADTPAHVVATLGQRHFDRDVALELIYREGEWRYSTMAKKIPSD